MFSIQHFLNKEGGDENNYSLFRMLEPTEQENINMNSQEFNESNENKGTQDNDVVVAKVYVRVWYGLGFE
jgi:hypothetical protein